MTGKPLCSYPDCDKPVKAKGLCSAHLSRQYRAEAALKHPTKSNYISSSICVFGRSHAGPVRIAESKSPLEALERSGGGLRLFACFFARPGEAKVVATDTQDKLREFGLCVERDWFDVSAADGIQAIRKCASIRPIQIYKPLQYANLAQEVKFDQRSTRGASEAWGVAIRDEKTFEDDKGHLWVLHNGSFEQWEAEEEFARLVERCVDSPE